jgi:AraC family transcriptional regulator
VREALAAKQRAGRPGSASARCLSRGRGWSLLDIVCSCGPHDPGYEERDSYASVAFVVAGSFRYRTARGQAVLIPGSLLLGNADSSFECGHEHGEGDRCLSFHYDPELMEEIAGDAGTRTSRFWAASVPPLREFARLMARSCLALEGRLECVEALALDVAAAALVAVNGQPRLVSPRPRDERRVAETVRYLETHSAGDHSLADLAHRAGLTQHHFLRVFRRAVGTTPHQFVLRLRLREAAARLRRTDEPVTSIAYDVGFQDLSNFIRTFAREFGLSPTRYRASRG